ALATREALLLHLLLLQAPGGEKAKEKPAEKPGDKPAAPPPEAGFRFWQAMKLARSGKYDEAVKALDEARARHAARRFLLLRKPQNPLSDPTEEIFLRTCDELKAAWTRQKNYANPTYLASLPEVKKLVKKADADGRVAGGNAVLATLAKELAQGTK